jgi:hypothetical protein
LPFVAARNARPARAGHLADLKSSLPSRTAQPQVPTNWPSPINSLDAVAGRVGEYHVALPSIARSASVLRTGRRLRLRFRTGRRQPRPRRDRAGAERPGRAAGSPPVCAQALRSRLYEPAGLATNPHLSSADRRPPSGPLSPQRRQLAHCRRAATTHTTGVSHFALRSSAFRT